MTWIKQHLAALVVIGALLDFAVFGVQGFQIHLLSSQQAQLDRQQVVLSIQARETHCWDVVLDKAVNRPPLDKTGKAQLITEAKHCRTLSNVSK